jgi:cerevisin
MVLQVCYYTRAPVILGLNQGFAGYFDDDVLSALKSSMDVEYIAEDGIMSTSDVQYVKPPPSVGSCHSNPSARPDASWNLARVSTRDELVDQDPFDLTYTYEYSSGPGSGVDIYVVDTGSFPPVRFR